MQVASTFTIPSQNLLPLTWVVHRLSVGNPPKPRHVRIFTTASAESHMPSRHTHGRSRPTISRNRWNSAVTTASTNVRKCRWNDFPASGNHRHDCLQENRHHFPEVGKLLAMVTIHGLREAAITTMAVTAGSVASNKGVSESLSALEGKGVRVRHESPSKAPKNGSQMVPFPVCPRRRNWQGVR